VADDQDGSLKLADRPFESLARPDVEVVGGLVQKQDLGIVHNRLGKQDTPLHSRGKLFKSRIRVEPDPGEDRLHPMVGPAGVMVIVFQSPGHLVGDGAAMSRGHVLGQSRDSKSLLADDRSLVGLDLAADQAEQRAFSLAVAPQQAESLSGLDLEIDLIEQPRAAEGQTDTAQTQ
jgi:hypothetical protein